MLLKRGIEIGSANTIKLWHKWAMWEMANGKILALVFRCCLIIKSYSSIKLRRIIYFVYILYRKLIGGRPMKRDLREVIGS